ncbi:MAG: ABC transporter permease [Chloroflexales bacterium]|nr:ABC transporter permease [Chloroflexales bacterium]
MASIPTAAGLELKDKKKSIDVGQIPQWRLMIRRFMRSKLSVGAGIVLVILYLLMIFADFVSPYEANFKDGDQIYAAATPMGFEGGSWVVYGRKSELNTDTFEFVYTTDYNNPLPVRLFAQGFPYRLLGLFPTTTHLFGVDKPADPDVVAGLHLWGTDGLGRDVFSRVLIGGRISLTIGLIGVAISVIIGAIFGTASGYFGGWIDNLMQRMIELIQSFPQLPLWAALSAAIDPNIPVERRFLLITVVLSLVTWTGLAREVRGKVLAFRTADYTAAARAAGSSHLRIILTHMIPNSLSHIIVVATLAVPATILGETALSFLGLGILPPAVSWGVLLQEAQQVTSVIKYPWLIIPAGAVVLAVLCYSLLGDGVRDAVDPYA